MKRNFFLILLPLILFLFTLQFSKVANTTPLFSIQSGARCGTCHVNPSGGMLRNNLGFYYGIKTLPWKTHIPESIEKSLSKVKDNKFINFGGDFRYLVLAEEDRDDNPYGFPMQADLYLGVNLLDYMTFFTQFGKERGGNDTVREVFGIFENFPFNSYVKVGKFLPPYGHRLDDHTAFIRERTGFNQSFRDAYTTGVEIGAEPQPLFGRLSFFNEDLTPGESKNDDERRGMTGMAGWWNRWLKLGLSYANIDNFERDSTFTKDRKIWGIFGALRVKNVRYLERLSYLFEWDFRRDERSESGGIKTEADAVISYNELNYRLTNGANFKLRYETFDPGEEFGEKDATRFIVGLDLYPVPFTELIIQYRINDEDPDRANNQFLFQFHLWF